MDRVLHRIDWTAEPHGLLAGIVANEATILDAHSNGGLEGRLRFPNHDAVSQFYDYRTGHDATPHVERGSTLTG